MIRRSALTALLAIFPALAQQGHPVEPGMATGAATARRLKSPSSWRGTVRTSREKSIPDPTPPRCNVIVDPTTWTVRFEADVKDASGKSSHVMAEGHVDDLGSYHRTLIGSWRQGSNKGDFKLTRD